MIQARKAFLSSDDRLAVNDHAAMPAATKQFSKA